MSSNPEHASYVVRISEQKLNLPLHVPYRTLQAKIYRMNLNYLARDVAYDVNIFCFEGRFAFSEPPSIFNLYGWRNAIEYRSMRGTLLHRISNGHTALIRVEPSHVLECLGEGAASTLAASKLSPTELDAEDCASWSAVFKLLSPALAVELAVKEPALAAHLCQEAATLFADLHPELAETWNIL